MKSDLIEKMIENIEEWRVELLSSPPHILENALRERLSICTSADIRVLGGFDSRIIYITDPGISGAYVISVGKLLIETYFYALFQTDIEQVDRYYGKVKPESRLETVISGQVKVGLVSLAKQEIYTFPRFALGVSDIAHALRNQYKSKVCLFDLQLINQEELLKIFESIDFDMIGISMTFGLFDVMKCLVSELLRIRPDIKVIVGGSLAAIDYKEVLSLFPNVIVSMGEGEKTLPQIIEWIYREKNLEDIPNIAYVNEYGRMITTKYEAPEHRMSLPELDLLIDTINAKGVFQLETSRGCYNACSFCPRQHKGYWKPVVEDIETLEFFFREYIELLTLHSIDLSRQIVYVVDEEFIGEECPSNRDRTEAICALFHKYGIRFEVSFRMSAVFASVSSKKEQKEKIRHIKAIHQYGLNRVLVGVESGVDSVLIRFHKNVSSLENTQGIRILTALGVPVRFTYITFDPLMSFEELVETYQYQGRKDLVMDPEKISDVSSLLDIAVSDGKWSEISLGIPFYHYISYMLVSLECLIGSEYYKKLEKIGCLEENTITALGKKNARYSDWRIGRMSKFAQLWVDHNFVLDYTLKSLGKIYPAVESKKIRAVRTNLKDSAYGLLGKFIYLCNQDSSLLSKQSDAEAEFVKGLLQRRSCEDNIVLCDEIMFNILEFQQNILEEKMNEAAQELKDILSKEDYKKYLIYYTNWKNNHSWQLIHKE